jgi:putative DNA primase/helicase
LGEGSRLTDSVTILRSPTEGAATKTWTWDTKLYVWGKKSYAMGAMFRVGSVKVDGIQSLGRLIETIAPDSRAFVIRGELRPEFSLALYTGDLVNRRLLATAGKLPPSFQDVDRRWVMADVDGWRIPDGLDLAEDVDIIVERAISELLPPCFHDVAAFWQLSSSAGFAQGILKCHIWFWLDRKVSTVLLKLFMKTHAPGIDQSLFNAVQVHYVAAPVIKGAPDPIPRRLGWVQGAVDTVVLPELNSAALAAATTKKRQHGAAKAGLSPSQVNTIDGALALLGDGDELDGFHEPLRRAVWLYAQQTPPWQRDAEALKARLRAATAAAPVDAGKRPGGVGDYLGDEYLDRSIFGAFVRNPQVGGWETCAPEYALPAGDAAQARARMRAAIAAFLSAPIREPSPLVLALSPDAVAIPRTGAVIVEVGLGKTEATLSEIATFIAAGKKASRPVRVLYFVPEHRLGTELLERARAKGIYAAAWYGRQHAPEGIGPMCEDLAAVEIALSVAANVGKHVCGPAHPRKNSSQCPHFAVCKYQQQRPIVAAADMVVMAHTGLFQKPPSEASKNVGLVVIDESFWQTGLGISSLTIETFAQDAIAHPVLRRVGNGEQIRDDEGTNDLHAVRKKLSDAFAKSPDGYLRRADLISAGLTAEDAATAGKLEWDRQVDNPMKPGMSRADRERAAEIAAINGQLPRFHAFWLAVRALLKGSDDITGRIEIATKQTLNGASRVVLVRSRREFSEQIRKTPVLILDATADLDLLKHYAPDVELLTQERPAAPHVTVRQVTGGLSKTSLHNRPGLVDELRDFVVLKARGEPALVITHLEFEKHFQGAPNVSIAHFGAIAGHDEWGAVRQLFVIGRPQPGPADTRNMAAQLTGRPVPLADPARATAGVMMADGSGVAIEVSRFDDPDLEAIRAAVTDAAIIQAVGRGRGVNRTAADPLDVWVLGNVIAPWPVAEIMRWPDVALRPVMRMAARGLVPENAADRARLYPDIYPSPDAARQARKREECDSSLYKEIHKGMSHSSPLEVRYRPSGAGQKIRSAWVTDPNPWQASEVKARLEAALGSLADFEIVKPGLPLTAPTQKSAPRPAPVGLVVVGAEPPFDLTPKEPALMPPAIPEPIPPRPSLWGDSSDAIRLRHWADQVKAAAGLATICGAVAATNPGECGTLAEFTPSHTSLPL